jgi:hypothetical protein
MPSTTLDSNNKASSITLSNSDLTCTSSSNDNKSVRSTTSKSSGKKYIEVTITDAYNGGLFMLGFGSASQSVDPGIGFDGTDGVAFHVNSTAYWFTDSGNTIYSSFSYGDTFDDGDILSVIVDFDNDTISFKRNDNFIYQNIDAHLDSFTDRYFFCSPNRDTLTINFGASSFNYTPPSGYSAWDVDSSAVSASVTGTVGNADAEGLTANVSLNYSVSVSGTVGDATADGLTANITSQNNATVTGTVGNTDAQGLTANISLVMGVAVLGSVGNADGQGLTATITAQRNATIDSVVGNSDAQGLTAGINVGNSITVTTTIGDCEALGLTATITADKNVVVTSTVGNSDAEGLTANISATLSANIEAVSAEGACSGLTARIIVTTTTDSSFIRYTFTIPERTTVFYIDREGSGPMCTHKFSKSELEKFPISIVASTVLGDTDSIASVATQVFDADTDVTSDIIASQSFDSNSCTLVVDKGEAGKMYRIKVALTTILSYIYTTEAIMIVRES